MAPQASALNKYNDFQALHHIQVYAFQFLSFLFKGWGGVFKDGTGNKDLES